MKLSNSRNRHWATIVTMGAALIIGVLSLHATAASACQEARYRAAAKYAACDLKSFGRIYGHADVDKVPRLLTRCRSTYSATWLKLHAKYPSTAPCNGPRFIVNGDGTVTDDLTALQWEQKTDDGSIHDKDDTYTWSTVVSAADGTAYTILLATLNAECFAGHCDWRLPTREELQTIVADTCTGSPCIAEYIFGPTAANIYWSSTSNVTGDGFAWGVQFANGSSPGAAPKSLSLPVRAVRGGL